MNVTKIKRRVAREMPFIKSSRRAIVIDATELEFKQIKNHQLPIEKIKETRRFDVYRIKPL